MTWNTVDIASPGVSSRRSAHLELSPSPLDVGNTLVGIPVAQRLTLTNTSVHDALFDRIAIVHADPVGQFSIAPADPTAALPTSLPAGRSTEILVLYTPTRRGTARCTLTIDVRDRFGDPSVFRHHNEVAVRGAARMPEIFLTRAPRYRLRLWDDEPASEPRRSLEMTDLDFGVAAPGAILEASFWIRNVGDHPLTIKGISDLRGAFSLSQPDLLPAILPPGGELHATCTFRAGTAPGASTDGELSVWSDDPLRGTVTLSVHGQAAAAPGLW